MYVTVSLLLPSYNRMVPEPSGQSFISVPLTGILLASLANTILLKLYPVVGHILIP